MSGDPFWSYVVLLMGFEGANAATSGPGMTDESSHAHGVATVSGTDQISTTSPLAGTSSLQQTGLSSNFLSFPYSIDWQLSTANSDQFTVEALVKVTTIQPPGNTIVAQFSGGGTAWLFGLNGSSELEFALSTTGSGAWTTDIISSGAGLTSATLYHLAVDKDATGKIRLYRNGVMVASATPANSAIFNTTTVGLNIGCTPGGNGIQGQIDELRITKGKARYASDTGFTVPTTPFPRGEGTLGEVTQIGAEQWAVDNPQAFATQIGVEYWAIGGTPTIGYLTQMAIEQWAQIVDVCVTDVTVSNPSGTSPITPADVYTYNR